jgi:predicted DCC family thiol-disulfide oxidoreductase YuxK
VQLVGPGGTTWQGAAAIERLLDVLPRGGLLGWVFSVPFVRALADRFYRWFARNRYRLGCGEHCALKPA